MWTAYSKKAAALREDKQALREYRRRCKEKRKDNASKSIKILKDSGIQFVQETEYRICIETPRIVYFPCTGKFIGEHAGRGVFNLLKILKKL
jgi:hypothetical protein